MHAVTDSFLLPVCSKYINFKWMSLSELRHSPASHHHSGRLITIRCTPVGLTGVPYYSCTEFSGSGSTVTGPRRKSQRILS
jgi:hypothetical protein